MMNKILRNCSYIYVLLISALHLISINTNFLILGFRVHMGILIFVFYAMLSLLYITASFLLNKKEIYLNSPAAAYTIFCIYALIPLVKNAFSYEGIYTYIKITAPLIIMLITPYIINLPKHFITFIQLIVIGTLINAVLTFYSFIALKTGTPFTANAIIRGINVSSLVRPLGMSGGPGATSASIIIGVLASFYLYQITKKQKYLFFIVIMILSLVTTLTRTGILALLMIFIFDFVLERTSVFMKVPKTLFKILIGIILIILVVRYIIGIEYVEQRLSDIPMFGKNLTYESGQGRWGLWMSTFEQLKTYNLGELLIGRGFHAAFEPYPPTPYAKKMYGTHCDFLKITVEMGILGLLIYLLFLLKILKYSIQHYKSHNKLQHYYGYILILAFFSYLLPYSFFGDSLLSSTHRILFFFLINLKKDFFG